MPPLAAQQTWPSFRNDGSGIARVAKAPIHWSPGENIAWRAEIPGYGQSAPVVWNGRIFVTSSDGPWQERGSVHAYELTTGKKLWSTPVAATTRHENYFATAGLRPPRWSMPNVSFRSFPRQRQANRLPPDQAPPKKGPEQEFAGMPEAMLHQIFSYGDPIVYGAALVEGCLLIRAGQHLYCVGTAPAT